MDKNFSKDILGTVNKKTGKNISEQAIKKIAGTITPETMQNEAQIRLLVKQVSEMANVAVSEHTVQEIVDAVRKSGLSMNNLEGLMKMMIKQ